MSTEDKYEGYRPLNDKQKQFLDIYLSNRFRAYEAYLQVYQNKKQSDARYGAWRILQSPYAQDYIKEERKKFQLAMNIDKEWLVEEYLKVMESCKTNGSDGEGTVTDRSNWNKALSQLSKLLGLDEPDQIDLNIKKYRAKFGD